MTLEIALELLILVSVVGVFVLVWRSGTRGDSGQVKDLQAQVAQLHQAADYASRQQGERIVELQRVLDGRLATFANQMARDSASRAQAERATRQELTSLLSQNLGALGESMAESKDALSASLDRQRTANSVELEKIRAEVGDRLRDTLSRTTQENTSQMAALTESTAKRQEELRQALGAEMEKVREHNETQLEKMRHTVDEKLQGTLEKRLGESFQLVSERLEQVQQGLGEMRNLATDVGGLKKVLTNVKTRGTWGEVQLSRQLQDLLSPEQYVENVAVDPNSAERVEFAVKLPGSEESGPMLLPIDSKFPQEPYERLLHSQEEGESAQIQTATKELERALRLQAKTISEKYVLPPHSTDFAIMYLPTEGLFAEALRIPGLASQLQSVHRVTIAGPTTLMALLGSLQMGFKTLAIEQRSSEVWQVLGAAKNEFGKYGQVWEKLGRQLQTAQNTVEEAGKRTRAVERRLRDVEVLEYRAEPALKADLLEFHE